MAAEDPKTAADLGQTFHRVSRSIRQSIALEAKLLRDAARAWRDATAATPAAQPGISAVRIVQRKAAVQKAVEQILFNERDPDAPLRGGWRGEAETGEEVRVGVLSLLPDPCIPALAVFAACPFRR